jgi:ribosomal protein S6
MDSKQVYEIAFHILPTVAEEKLADEVSVLQKAIEAGEGTVISEEFPKMRDLEYAIKKYIDTKKTSFDTAYFGWIKFESEPSLAGSLKKVADEHPHVLRYLIIKTVKENTLLTKPAEREERKETPKDKGEKEVKEKGDINEETIDESIEELVIE